MAIMLPPVTLSGAMPSAATLLGTAASAEIIQEVNAHIGSTFIGQKYDEFDNIFIRQVVMPTRQGAEKVRQTAAVLGLVDAFVPIETPEDLAAGVPPCMQLPLLMFPPVRSLFESGRITGFGYDPDCLPQEDVWGRMLNNGVVENLQDIKPDSDGVIHFETEFVYRDSDPDLTVADLDCIESLRTTAMRVLETTLMSPTDMSSLIA